MAVTHGASFVATDGDEALIDDDDEQANNPSNPPPVTYVLDPDGDLCVIASGTNSMRCNTPAKFQVCSSTLRRCSPVFRKMLFGGFAESQPAAKSSAEWVVKLPDDAASAIKTLFEIMHCKFHSLNGAQNAHSTASDTILPQLYDLLVVSDKYDTIGLLRHWIREWHSSITKESYNEGPKLLQASWCYYQMGDLQSYKKAVLELIMVCPDLDKLECGKTRDPTLPTVRVLPPGFMDSIRFQRSELVESLLQPIRQSISCLSTGQRAGFCTAMMTKWLAAPDAERIDCEARILGFTIQQMQKHRLWPVPPPRQAKCTPCLMLQLHQNLVMRRAQHSQKAQHDSCATNPAVFGLSGVRDQELRRMVLAGETTVRLVDDVNIAYMTRQREITGLLLWSVEHAGKLEPYSPYAIRY
ncbi:armadillo repeat-containing protein 5 [Microdochium nivale]|nr:armadillo repeat-containing protein 5 [Microdochium nivale]